MVKGSVAGAAGIALLMGGFGTYATWTDSEALEGGTVQTGQLDIATAAAVWDDLSTTDEVGDWDPTADLLVPGDTVTMTQEFVITAQGKNLAAEMVFSGWNQTPGNPASLTVTPEISAPAGVVVDSTDPNRWTFSELNDPVTVTATVTYAFDGAATDAENTTAAMDGASFTVSQVTN